MLKDLIGIGARLGVRVELANIVEEVDADAEDMVPREQLLGYFDPAARTIIVQIGMTRRQTRAVLAHEIAHVQLDHPCTRDDFETQANRIAAMMLVSLPEYLAAERIDASPYGIAEELDVPVDIVLDYRALCLERIGDRTYERARMGAGQWRATSLA